jgi:hypothetical protein
MKMTEQKDSLNVETPKPSGEKEKPILVVLLLLILVFLFISTAVMAVTGFDIWRVVFNPPLVKEILTEEFIDSDLVPRVLADISARRAEERVEKGEALSGVDEPDIQLLISYVSFESWMDIKELLITDEFITHLVSVTIDGFYDWLDSDAPAPDFVWDMAPLKERLVGEEGVAAIMIAYESMPECTQEEIDDFTSRLAEVPPGVEVLYNLCQFPDPWREDQLDDYRNALIDVNQNIPESYDFAQMLGGDAGSAPLKRFLQTARTIGQWGWVVPLVLLALILAIGVRSMKDLGKWGGIPLMITGALVVGLTLGLQSLLLNLVVNRFPFLVSEVLREELRLSFGRITGHVFQPMLIQGGVLLVVGLVLLILGLVLGKKKTPQPVEEGAGEEKGDVPPAA